MKIELETQDIEAIAQRVVELLKPVIAGNGGKDAEGDVILSIEQASMLLGKSKEQIYQWVNLSKHGLKDFPYMKAGKSLRFSKNKLLEWMQNR